MSTPAGTPTDGPRRFLALTPQVPNPTQQGAAIRNWNLLAHIARHYTIDVLAFGNPGDEGSRQRPGLPVNPGRG